MKRFLIKYHLTNGSKEDWHEDIKRFVAAIERDPLEVVAETAYRP
jgi:hypothetical protein